MNFITFQRLLFWGILVRHIEGYLSTKISVKFFSGVYSGYGFWEEDCSCTVLFFITSYKEHILSSFLIEIDLDLNEGLSSEWRFESCQVSHLRVTGFFPLHSHTVFLERNSLCTDHTLIQRILFSLRVEFLHKMFRILHVWFVFSNNY